MLKRALILLTGIIPLLVIAAMVLGARSLWVPIPKDRHEDCFYAAKQSGNKHPDCRLYETIWERGSIDPTAYYTLWLTLFTGVLASVGIAGGIFTWRQIKLGRDEFNATHRPRIIVRFLQIEPLDAESLPVSVTIANVGVTSAIIESVTGDVAVRDSSTRRWRQPGLRGATPSQLFSGNDILVAGGRDTFRIASQGRITDITMAIEARNGQIEICAIGQIRYRDGAGAARITGYIWKYRPITESFDKDCEPEFSFED